MGRTFSEKAKLLLSLSAVAFFLSCGVEKRSTVAQVPAVTPAVRPLPLKPPVALPDYPPAPGPDAADVLVSQVEALYKAGMADYRSGNLEGAKEQLDQAVEKLLESKLDVQGDDRLSGEFDKLVEGARAFSPFRA